MRRRAEEVVKHVQGDVLHVGCVGEYLWLDELDHNIWIHGDLVEKLGHDSVVGIDYFERGIEAVQEDGYEVYHANAEDFNLDRTFDTILAPQMVHHLSNPGLAIKRFNAHLKPEGKLVFAHPNHFFIERQLAYLMEARRGEDRRNRDEKPEDYTHHTATHRPENLIELVEREDFKLQEGYYVESGSTPSSLKGIVWHRGILPLTDILLPHLFSKKTFVAIFEPTDS